MRYIRKGIYDPKAMAFDALGRLYVANNFTNQISVYLPGKRKPRRYITGIFYPQGLAIDQSADVAVLSESQVYVYGPNGARLMAITESSQYAYRPFSIAFDPSGNLWVTAIGNKIAEIEKFQLGSSAPSATITEDVGVGPVAFDASGNLYCPAATAGIAVFPPGSTTPTRVIPVKGRVSEMAFDLIGNLFVATHDAINAFNPQTGNLLYSISKGIREPSGLAFDANNHLYVSSVSLNDVTIYAADTGALLSTINAGINQPAAIAFGP